MNTSLRILLLSILLSSCCSNIDCANLRPILNFRYLSENGADLLSGDSKKYEITDFKIYSVDLSGSEQFATLDLVTEQGAQSFCTVLFINSNERWFFELKGTVLDTLDLKFKTNEGRCCGEQTWIEELSVNGNLEGAIGTFGTEVINLFENN